MKWKILILLLLLAAPALAQERTSESVPDAAAGTFTGAAAQVQVQLEEAIAELDALRARIAEEQIPLSRRLSDLEAELIEIRLDYQQTSRVLDRSRLDLNNLQTEIKSRQEEATYLSGLLGDYVREFDSRVHIAERQRYEEALSQALLAPENSNLSPRERFALQAALLDLSLGRLEDALGGTRFAGTAVNANGLVKEGTFVMVGPSAIFRSAEGSEVGTAEQRLGSLEPTQIAFANPEDAAAASRLIGAGEGLLPLDPTLGNAHKIEATHETLWEHIRKGGPVMVPIFILAGAAMLVAFFKWIGLTLVRKPSPAKIAGLVAAVGRHDEEDARARAWAIKGPVGAMLSAGIEQLHEPRELVEEVMYEKILTARLKLQRFLPFVAIAAASAPLLGLLGTVTGIINTFKLITVFGSGDVKTLSGGISEALITTEFGLIVAIPSLLLHAFLSRKARGVVDVMEKAAVALVNQVAKTPYYTPPPPVIVGSDHDRSRDDLVRMPGAIELTIANLEEKLRDSHREAVEAALAQLKNSTAVKFDATPIPPEEEPVPVPTPSPIAASPS